MVAAISRYLHTPVDMVEEWEVDKFFHYHEQVGVLLKAESPET